MSEISKKDRFTVPAVICLICNVLLFIHLCGAGAYAGGNLHYEAANTQMERNEEFFLQFFLSNHLMGIAETLAMVAALIALLMVSMFGGKVPWSAGQSCGIFAFLTVSSF